MKTKYCQILITLLFFITSYSIYGNTTKLSTTTSYHLVFVVDCSNSINATDSNGIIPEFISLFTDTLPASQVDVGLIMYNDRIVNHLPLTPLNTEKERLHFKTTVFNTPNTGYTDIGLALKEATNMLKNASGSHEQSIILLISDGETALPQTSSRTINESNEDRKQAIHFAQTTHTPIYTFQVGDYDGKDEILSKISSETQGSYFKLNTYNDALSHFLTFHEKNAIQLVTELTPTNSTLLTSDILPAFTDENTLCFVNANHISNAKIKSTATDIPKYTTSHHASYLLDSLPTTNSFSLDDQSDTTAYLLSHYSPTFSVNLVEPLGKNKPVSALISATQDKTGESIINQDFYADIVTSLQLNEKDSVLSQTVSDKGISILFTPKQSGQYLLTGQLIHPSFITTLAPFNIKIKNAVPTSNFPDQFKFCVSNEKIAFNLDDYFADDDAEPLDYTLEALSSDPYLELNGPNLIINRSNKQNLSFKIKATDPEGAVYTTNEITLKILPFFQYYQWLSLLLLLFLCMVIVIAYFWKNHNKKELNFSGKLKGNFITPRYEEIFPFDFALYMYHSHLTFYELLQTLNGAPKLRQTQSLHLLPSAHHCLILYYTEDLTVLINNNLALKNKRYILQYGDVISISFEDSPLQIIYTYDAPVSLENDYAFSSNA